MIEHDVLLATKPEGEELRRAVSAAAGIEAERVFVTPDITTAQGEDYENARVVIERVDMGGEFPVLLHFYPRAEETAKDPVPEVKRLAAILKCRVLIDDDSDNPWQMLEVTPDGTTRTVYLDPDSEDLGEFNLLKAPNGERKVA